MDFFVVPNTSFRNRLRYYLMEFYSSAGITVPIKWKPIPCRTSTLAPVITKPVQIVGSVYDVISKKTYRSKIMFRKVSGVNIKTEHVTMAMIEGKELRDSLVIPDNVTFSTKKEFDLAVSTGTINLKYFVPY